VWFSVVWSAGGNSVAEPGAGDRLSQRPRELPS
jgi:hypothetical protein